jgi:DNA-binding PadR family transcriptional regulator
MSLQACILGLLALRPMTGYELKNTFDRSVSYNWSASATQIYSTLKTLAKNGLVESHLVVQESKPNKRVYQITPEGLSFLKDWLTAPAEPRLAKDVFLVRVFFANYVDDGRALQILEQYLASMEKQVEELLEIRNRVNSRPSHNPRARFYQLMALDLRVAGLNGMIAEARRQMEQIRNNLSTSR